MEITINEITDHEAQRPGSPTDGSIKKMVTGSPLNAGISAATTMPGTDVNTSFC